MSAVLAAKSHQADCLPSEAATVASSNQYLLITNAASCYHLAHLNSSFRQHLQAEVAAPHATMAEVVADRRGCDCGCDDYDELDSMGILLAATMVH